MFSHGQGVLTPLQRLVGNNRPHRGESSFFSSGNMEMIDSGGHCSIGMPQPDFDTFGQPNHLVASFSDRSVASDMGSFPAVLMGQNYAVHQMEVSLSGSVANRETSGSLGTRMLTLKCPECGIVKHSNGELEIHIKNEHLGWLPFQCPICPELRASDQQMREHIHSNHKKNEIKYIYMDNPRAKEMLQEMVDKALYDALQCAQQMMKADGASAGGGTQQQKGARLDGINTGGDRRLNSAFTSKKIDDEMAPSRQTLKSSTPISRNEANQSAKGHFGHGKGRKANSGTDTSADYSSDDTLEVPDEEEEEENNFLLVKNKSLQQRNMTTDTFSTSGGDSVHQMGRGNGGQQQQQQDYCRRIVRNRPGPMTSKKRVLGLCAECNKPITAGARQMHMFYHLGKQNSYRFRCKYPGCKVQHYRKDQMENHQTKAHGKINAEMMEDKSAELYDKIQEMSMKLLGTTGNTPGPTAGEAQRRYENQMRDMEANLGTRKRRRPEYFASNLSSGNNNGTVPRSSGGLPIYDSANRRVEELECRRCNKFILNRIKGFHILWHLNTDLGIVRYGCKHCNFKHDRPQSVAAHGLREHSDETACVDLLYNFEPQLLAMSKDCFGVGRLFEKEIRRRNRLERFARSQPAAGNSFDKRIGSGGNSQQYISNAESKQSQQFARRRNFQCNLVNPKVKPTNENAVDRKWTPDEDGESANGDENEAPSGKEEEEEVSDE